MRSFRPAGTAMLSPGINYGSENRPETFRKDISRTVFGQICKGEKTMRLAAFLLVAVATVGLALSIAPSAAAAGPQVQLVGYGCYGGPWAYGGYSYYPRYPAYSYYGYAPAYRPFYRPYYVTRPYYYRGYYRPWSGFYYGGPRLGVSIGW